MGCFFYLESTAIDTINVTPANVSSYGLDNKEFEVSAAVSFPLMSGLVTFAAA